MDTIELNDQFIRTPQYFFMNKLKRDSRAAIKAI